MNLEQRKIKVVVTSIDYEHSDTEFDYDFQNVSFYADVYDVKTNKKLFSNLYLGYSFSGIDKGNMNVTDYLEDDDDILDFLASKNLDPEIIEDLHELENNDYDFYLEQENYKQKWSWDKLNKLYLDKEFEKNYLAQYYDAMICEQELFEDYTLGDLHDFIEDNTGFFTEDNFLKHLSPELTKNDIIEICGEDEIWINIHNINFWGDSDGFGINKKKFKKAPEILSVSYDIYSEENFIELIIKKYFGNKIRVNKYWYINFDLGSSGYSDGDVEFNIKLKDLDKVFGENFEKENAA